MPFIARIEVVGKPHGTFDPAPLSVGGSIPPTSTFAGNEYVGETRRVLVPIFLGSIPNTSI